MAVLTTALLNKGTAFTRIGQTTNAVSGARLISAGMLAAAASALSSLLAVWLPGASPLPHITVTVAVAAAEDAMCQPKYRRIQAS